jgi:hypothetical protein
MGLWDKPKRISPELAATLRNLKLPSPEELAKALAEHLKTHCEHGNPRGEHCPWCYIQTPAYRQSLADAMWTRLD